MKDTSCTQTHHWTPWTQQSRTGRTASRCSSIRCVLRRNKSEKRGLFLRATHYVWWVTLLWSVMGVETLATKALIRLNFPLRINDAGVFFPPFFQDARFGFMSHPGGLKSKKKFLTETYFRLYICSSRHTHWPKSSKMFKEEALTFPGSNQLFPVSVQDFNG